MEVFSKVLFFIGVFTGFAAALVVSGQPVKDNLNLEQKKLAENALIKNLIIEARSQTPEIAADALLTMRILT